MDVEYSVSAIKPYSIVEGVVTVDYDAPPAHLAIKKVWRDDQGRRCTTFLGEAYSPDAAQTIVDALNAASSPPTP